MVVARDEALEQAFGSGNQNGDGDADDRVVHFIDLGTNTEVTTGMAVQEAYGKPILTSEGSKIAFLQSEIRQNRTDFVGDGDLLDGVLRVWTSDGTHPSCDGSPCELTAGLPSFAVDPDARIKGTGVPIPQPIAFSGGADPSRYVFFIRSEPGEAPTLTTRLSEALGGGQAAGPSRNPSVSDSGRHVAFTAETPGVSGSQIFHRDLSSADPPTLVSQGLGDSDNASVVDLGPFAAFNSALVAFDSFATNPGDTEGQREVFRASSSFGLFSPLLVSWNLSTGESGNGRSSNPHLSAGSLVYQTEATNLVAGDTNGVSDIIQLATIVQMGQQVIVNLRVSVTNAGGQANGASTNAAVSDDASVVVFQSLATNLGPEADANGVSDIYLRDIDFRDIDGGTTERISRGYAGSEANGASTDPDLSSDGRYVVFASSASNLLPPGVTLNDPTQCYVYDRDKKTTALVSATLGGQGANAACLNPSIDPSGRYASFASAATNLDPLATTPSMRIYFHDLLAGHVATATPTNSPTGTRSEIGITEHRILVYDTIASDLGVVDTNGVQDVYAAEVQASPSLNTGDPFPDDDNQDGVLFVFDTAEPHLHQYPHTHLPDPDGFPRRTDGSVGRGGRGRWARRDPADCDADCGADWGSRPCRHLGPGGGRCSPVHRRGWFDIATTTARGCHLRHDLLSLEC